MENTPDETERFGKAISRVAIVSAKGTKPDRAVLREYWLALKEFNIDTIEDVADRILETQAELISVPPPGFWRKLALEMFELRARQPKRPGAQRCPTCDDTGWRLEYRGGTRVAVPCQHDGTPDEQPELATPRPSIMMELEGEVGPPESGETELAKRRREHGNQILHCMCCGAPYRVRTGRRCVCATPPGMSSVKWLSLAHKDCPNPTDGAVGKGNTRCRNHCGCTPEQRAENRPKFFPTPAEGQHVDDFLKEQGLRDKNAPGPEDPPPYDDDLGF